MPKICTKFLPFLNKQFNNNYYIKFAHLFIYTNFKHVKTFELKKKYIFRHHSINLEVALDTDLGHTIMIVYVILENWNPESEKGYVNSVASNKENAEKIVSTLKEFQNKKLEDGDTDYENYKVWIEKRTLQ